MFSDKNENGGGFDVLLCSVYDPVKICNKFLNNLINRNK